MNGKSSGSPPSLCLASLSLYCRQVITEETGQRLGLPCRHPVSRGRGVLVQYCPENRVELVGCGVCEVAKLCLKVLAEGSSVDGAEVAGYSVHRCRWSHGDFFREFRGNVSMYRRTTVLSICFYSFDNLSICGFMGWGTDYVPAVGSCGRRN